MVVVVGGKGNGNGSGGDGEVDEGGGGGGEMFLKCNEASSLGLPEVLRQLDVRPERGLSSAEVSRRRDIFGFNEVDGGGGDPLWKKYLEQFKNPFILLLLASALISVVMRQFDDAISITAAIVIVITVGFVQEYRSEKTLEKLGQLLPPACLVLRDGGLQQRVLGKHLVPGDVILLEVGDRIPADALVVEATDLMVDESSFTGEPVPKPKVVRSEPDLGGSKNKDISDMDNVCFQGTLVTAGHGIGVVVATGERSQFGEIFKAMRSEEPPRTPLQKSMDLLGKQLTLYSLTVIALIMLVGWIQGRHILDMFNVGVSLAVAAIPEGLPIVVTVTLAFGVMRMAGKRAIVKRLPTVEALGCVDVICSDKTGTLTTNEMTVYCERTMATIFPGPGDSSSSSSSSPSQVHRKQQDEVAALCEVGVLCNNSHVLADGKISGSSTERAVVLYARKNGYTSDTLASSYQRLSEVPFSSERKYMAVLCRRVSDGAQVQFAKGAVEEILAMCSHVFLGAAGQQQVSSSSAAAAAAMTANRRDLIVQEADNLAGNGLRVLALARGPSLGSLQFVGLLGLHDPPRPGVQGSVQALQASGVRVCMITGDGKETARAICEMVGIDTADKVCLSGAQVDEMSEVELSSVAENVCTYFRTGPLQKLKIVKALQRRGHIVGMTGDGVNDGVAIKCADVGIAMGAAGTDVCREAADMVLLDDDFSTILSAIEEGKCIFYNIRNFVSFQLSTSIAALILISLSTLLDIPNPLNPMQILWINVIMDGPPAQSLGLEPANHSVLRKPPRKRGDQILNRRLLFSVVLSASIIISGTMWVLKSTMEDGTVTTRDTTMTFTCFVFFDMFNALSSRSQDRLIFEVGFFKNRVFWVAVVLSVLGQFAVIYAPPLQYVFQTEALEARDVVFLIILSSSVFVVSELRKLIVRRFIDDRKGFFPWSRTDHFKTQLRRDSGYRV